MKVFISWSGEKSNKVARVFKEWLPSVIQSIEPYVSSEDIDKGARWSTDIATELEHSSFGILCVTKDNLNAPWLAFEAGALSKTMDKAFVSPFLFDIKRSAVKGPMLQFQSTVFEESDIKKLVVTLNKACEAEGITDAMLDKAFEVWYPSLANNLNAISGDIIEEREAEPGNYDGHTKEMVEEILELSRGNQRILSSSDPALAKSIGMINDKIDSMTSKLNQAPYVEKRSEEQHYRYSLMRDLLQDIMLMEKTRYGFLMLLSFFNSDFPWIYEMGKELLQTISSRRSINEKREAATQFFRMVDNTLGHPLARRLENGPDWDRRLYHEAQFMLSEYVEELLAMQAK